ncbi:DNA-binding MarR family transcriptional regulator [Sulfuritortus calidifontis]|uniref:DNA-binding MarR family transcriptional regulator n=1 Tax=Sulfuritortus calidifontis TaxID=1914471 RepID=A0A4V2UQD2_9PROT|nr:MarR family transcriptional regulator [Sulfuritortus calidifontis]TCS70002.1 DNA-binding MarR family transcriptional regulator [Sulfuritortus calidifontis]
MSAQEVLAREALKQFRLIFGSARSHFRAVEKACGVSGAQVWVMAVLAERPGLKVSELAEALSIHQSTASNLINKLEKTGLLRRERGKADQRVVRLYLSQAGEAALARAPRPFTGILPYALEQLPVATLRRLIGDLRKVLSHVGEVDETAASKPLSEL